MMPYISLLGIWIMMYFAPMFAGAWYDQQYNFYQSTVALILIIAASPLAKHWYIRSFGCICLLQLSLNVADSIVYVPADNYNQIVTVLNLMEFVLLFIIGGISQWRQYHDNRLNDHVTAYGRGSRR